MESEKKSFKYVYIPWDVNESIEELEMDIPPEDEVLCLINRLKNHFHRKGPKKTKAQKQAHMQALRQTLGDSADNVSADLLNTASGLQLVENIALLANSPDTGFVGVNMYCDDEGRIKDLPANPRASELTVCCGRPLDVRGDAFLARVFDNEEDFERQDFRLADLSSSAPWMAQARGQNVRKQQQGPPEEILARIKKQAAANKAASAHASTSQPPATPAEEAKQRGNTAFKQGLWQEAIDHYSAAIKLDSGLTAALNNRAMAYLKQGQFPEALADCERVLQEEPGNVKAQLRRAFAHKSLGRLGEALAGYEAVLQVQPGNQEAVEQVEGLRREVAAVAPAPADASDAGL